VAGPRRATWAWPFVLALVFVAAIAAWSQWTMLADIEEQRRTLLTDALTVQSRVSDALLAEQQVIRTLAAAIPARADNDWLLRQGVVVDGLHRLWVSVTLLDTDHRVLAHVPDHAPLPAGPYGTGRTDDAGLSAHLVQPTRQGGELIVRFAPAALLRMAVPWWLARRYDIRLVDGMGQRVAGAVQTLPPLGRQSHVVSLEPQLADTYLELTTREAQLPWWRTLLPLLMAIFIASSAAATAMLRRRLMQVEAAELRWRTEAAWRRAIEDSLTVGLRARNLEGRTVHVNRAFCDLVGLPPEQLLGGMPPLPYWPPDELEQGMERLRRNLSGGAPRDGYVTRWVRGDGRRIEVMVFEAPLVDAAGHHTGWMGSIVDVTERRKAEERERRQGELLATQARLNMLGEVASALAHQLNQPLTAIASYGAGALRTLQAEGYDDAMVLDALQRLAEQAVEAGRVVQRIRGFLTRRNPQREPCRVDELLARTQALLGRELQRQGVEVQAVVEPGLPEVLADAVLIEQVLINLVRNAADALAEQRPERPLVRIRAARAGTRFVRIDVVDNGPGLDGADIRRLCEPFYSTKRDGMGMGLAICRSIVEAHHGAMEAGPGGSAGAMLSFTLPAVDVEQPADETPLDAVQAR
jgi:two-component system, LuxR family, sensor histidine kinase DctS